MSSISKKTLDEQERMRRAGRLLRELLEMLAQMVRPGVSTRDLDDEAMRFIEKVGAEPVLLGYHPEFAPRPFPAAICTSINDVVVHGVPNESPIVFAEGDIVGIDTTIGFEGMIVDSARTVAVGRVDALSAQLIAVTQEACTIGISAARPGGRVGEIGHAISTYVRPFGFSLVEELCGHGVGYAVHEPPFVPNIGRPDEGEVLEPGMTLAIEPMINAGGKDVVFADDGYTVYTKDGSRSAHFEHTVLITQDGAERLT